MAGSTGPAAEAARLLQSVAAAGPTASSSGSGALDPFLLRRLEVSAGANEAPRHEAYGASRGGRSSASSPAVSQYWDDETASDLEGPNVAAAAAAALSEVNNASRFSCGYGTLASKAGERVISLKTRSPIFLENPDGTIMEAIPASSNSNRKKARAASRAWPWITTGTGSGSEGSSDIGSIDSAESIEIATYMEVDMLYSRHEKMLALILLLEFGFEAIYNMAYCVNIESSVHEFTTLYALRIPPNTAYILFRAIFALQISYSFFYYGLATAALWSKRPKHYRIFVTWSMLGILLQALLAYIDKFNLLIFSTRLAAFIYGRFLQGLAASLLLLPQS